MTQVDYSENIALADKSQRKNSPRPTTLAGWLEQIAPQVFIFPAVLIVLLLAVFPLFVSLYLSLARVQLVRGGYDIEFVGLINYKKLFFGSEQRNFLGRFGEINPLGWGALALLALVMVVLLYSHLRRKQLLRWDVIARVALTAGVAALVWLGTNALVAESGALAGTWFAGKYWLLTALPLVAGVIVSLWLGVNSLLIRTFVAGFLLLLAYLTALTLNSEGLPGTLVVTLIFVFGGVTAQYLIGLGLALLVTQNLPGKRFFRIIFLLPMMITPVGVGFLFRMLTDTLQGPFSPLWKAVGLSDFSWVDSPFGARLAIIIGDTWQWTPFMFIILLAALEGISTEPIEAALVDGANRWQMFRFIILPEVIPVSITLLLIRTIEAFKVIDLPRVMTRGGPGTATESVTLYAFNQWKASATSIGFSSAIAYVLLIVVTFFAMVLVNIARRRVLELTQ
ncbi:MAG: carbohydrate ABC transporter permease [Phototrophicaceae bacterium]